MSVAAEIDLSPNSFQLGRVLEPPAGTTVILEKIVPLGKPAVPLVRVRGSVPDEFEAHVSVQDGIHDFHVVSEADGETLYALEWDVPDDDFLSIVQTHDGTLIEVEGSEEGWSFQLLFPDREALSAFYDCVRQLDIPTDVRGIYNPTVPEKASADELSEAQRQAFIRAVEAGYYDFPRNVSTSALADEFGISDQAMTERLRRAIRSLAHATVLKESGD